MVKNRKVELFKKKLSDLLSRKISDTVVPGVSLGLIRGGELFIYIGLGNADIARGFEHKKDTIYRVASITKTFTATAIMQLKDARLLSLDDPLLIYLPEFATARAQAGTLEGVTIKRILTHRSGLVTEHPSVDWNSPIFPSMRHIMDSMDKVSVVLDQDSRWKYSNLGYGLLGEVISRLTGMPYVKYLKKEIINPLNLENTGFDLRNRANNLCSQGYSLRKNISNGFEIAPDEPINGLESAGQLYSSTADIAKWIEFQMYGSNTKNRKILSSKSINEMHTPVYVDNDWTYGQCIGWRAIRRSNRVFLNHGGGIHGFTSAVAFNSASKTGVVIFANLWPLNWPSEVAIDICNDAIDIFGPVVDNPIESEKNSGNENSDDTSSLLKIYVGEYRAEPGIYLKVKFIDGNLHIVARKSEDYSLHIPAMLQPTAKSDIFQIPTGRAAGEIAEFSMSRSRAQIKLKIGGFLYIKER